MGGWISVKINDAEEDEKKIRKYEEAVDKNPYGFGFEEEGDKSVIKWYEWLIYDMRSRIVYAILLGLLLGLVIPLIIFLTDEDKNPGTIYGSCLINKEARLECLINSVDTENEDSCIAAMCCWEKDDTLPFKCFHSFPSAYQYELQSISVENSTGKRHILRATPNHRERMTDVQVDISETDNILHIELFDPEKFPDRAPKSLSRASNFTQNEQRSYTTGNLTVKYGAEKNYFFFQVVRILAENEEESLFDTRLGPIQSHKNYTTISTVLPTKYVYGLKGGQNVVSKDTVTYGVVNGFQNAELPFYMVLEKSGSWHAVLLETDYPFMAQLVNLPAVTFHIEGPMVSVNLKFFAGPTRDDILSQFRSYMVKKTNRPPIMPPYWGLGLHLCGVNQTLDNITKLEEMEIPYDSVCIDDNLRIPFTFKEEDYPEINEIVEYLSNNSKKIMLSLSLAIPTTYQIDEPDFLVMVNHGNSLVPFEGTINNVSVVYPNLFHDNSQSWLGNQATWPHFPFHGMILPDNFPKNENKSPQACSSPGTKLSSLLVNSSTTFANETWSSLCYDLVHKINDDASPKNHLEVHNIYGHEALVQMATVLESKTDDNERFLLSGSSLWTDSFLYGGFSGMQVPFTWDGLRDSLAQILRNFILFPFSGTPICGSHMPNNTEFDDTLCLRWFQLALVLPFARNIYGVGKVGGPFDFKQVYRNYLINNIKERYTFIPYFYTLFHEYHNTAIPPIRPMSFEFHSEEERNITFGLVDQFMIGSSVMAVPILTRALERYAYFPRGIWYDLSGNLVWSNTTTGGTTTVVGHITQTPLFLQAGHILPVLAKLVGDEEVQIDTAEKTRNGNYSILVTPPANSERSIGSLYVDDGISRTNNDFNKVDLSYYTSGVNESTLSIKASCLLTDDSISSTISQIKIFGFSFPKRNITITDTSQPGISDHTDHDYDEDIFVLNIHDLNIDWCMDETTEVNVTISYSL